MKLKSLFVVALSLSFTLTFAGDIDKAFKSLTSADYPNAVKFLKEVWTEEPGNPAAAYGLAKYFSMRDNKAYNLDSANAYIKLAAAKIPLPTEDKNGKKWVALGVRDYTIQTLQKSINFEAYSQAEKENTLESYQHFVDQYTDPSFLEQAINFRNQKAFMRALSLKSPDALNEFIQKYPQASEAKEAKERYEKMVYEQTTADRTFQSYKKYLDQYPKGAFVTEAKKNYEEGVLDYYHRKNSLEAYLEFEKQYASHPSFGAIQDTIYRLVTKTGTVASYKTFVNKYINNRNINEAWQQLYVLYTAKADEAVYQSFLQEFPNYGNKAQVNKDIELSRLNLKPMQQGEKWGYVRQDADNALTGVIPFEYDEAYNFSCGFAAVRSKACIAEKCTYFYIDKNNQRAFENDFNYAGDFSDGFAIVGIGNCETEDCKYGLIDKRGRWVLQPQFEEVDELTEGYYLAAKDGRYGFINQQGETVISFKYTNALPFSQGIAAVAIDGNWFFVDKDGKQVFIDRFQDVFSYSDSLCAVSQDGTNWGYIDMTGKFVIEAQFESAEPFLDGFAIVSKKEKDPKAKGLFISQRYKINKAGKIVEKLTAPKPVATKTTSRRRGR
jgi:hypothetical protein